MSDYLWDKSGAPDEEVERLENLLGQLRYQPKPLELPKHAPPSLHPAPRAFFSARYAAAAALILTLLASAWFVAQHHTDAVLEQSMARRSNEAVSSPRVPPNLQATQAQGTSPANGRDAAAQAPKRDEQDGRERDEQDGRAIQPVSVNLRTHRSHPHVLQGARPQLSAPRPAFDDTPLRKDRLALATPASTGARRVAQGEIAKRQLMLALRLASEKFNVARREVREIARGDGAAKSFK